MTRIFFGILIGTALTLLVMSANPVTRNANGNDGQISSDALGIAEQELIGTVRQAILSPLYKNIADEASTDSGKFLNKLFNAYDLDKTPAMTDNQSGLIDMVPDIQAINEKALSLPLIVAGKSITDKEIAAFYYDFIQRCGWNIAANDEDSP